MAKILNIGSLNIDHFYELPHLVRPGETLSTLHYRRDAGGKGMNQSLALARAGAQVVHAGKIGEDGVWLEDLLKKNGVECRIARSSDPTGHAIIQVDDQGENAIVLYGGANQKLNEEEMDFILSKFTAGDFLLLQNEVNLIPLLIAKAHAKGMTIVFNPAPMHPEVLNYPLHLVDLIFVNEGEGAELAGKDEEVMTVLRKKFPRAQIILTLGSQGAIYGDSHQVLAIPAEKGPVLDTTGAGDTFIGYYLASLFRGRSVADCLAYATKAASLCVSRKGAQSSIPFSQEVSLSLGQKK